MKLKQITMVALMGAALMCSFDAVAAPVWPKSLSVN